MAELLNGDEVKAALWELSDKLNDIPRADYEYELYHKLLRQRAAVGFALSMVLNDMDLLWCNTCIGTTPHVKGKCRYCVTGGRISDG